MMPTTSSRWQDLLVRLATSMNDSELATFLSVHSVRSDDDLADAIDIDGRARDEENTAVDLHRYMTAIPNLQDRPVVLDTALEATLRSMRRAGIDQVQAVAILVEDYPRLAAPIRTCAMLDQCVVGTTTIASGVSAAEPLTLPCGIGELMEDGRARYELREVIGRGNQAMVYLSVDRRLSAGDSPAWVAIKVMQHRSTEDFMPLPALGSEAHAARRVNHPNVVRVLDRGITDCREFVVYEYVRGMTLHEARTHRSGPAEPHEAARLVVQIARGLQAAHNAAVLHCDLKPANVLLTESGVPKIADFGLARHLQADDLAEGPVGSFAFMSPEQFSATPDSNMTTTDIYALGGVLYWLLTDLPPNGADAETVGTRLRLGTEASPANPAKVNPAMDADLAAICAKAIHPRRQNRYASAEAFATDLEQYLALRPLAWNSPSISRRTQLAFRRSPRAFLSTVGACVAAVAAMTFSALLWHWSAIETAENEVRLSREQLARKDAEQAKELEAARIESAGKMARSLMSNQSTPRQGQFENWLQGTVVMETVLMNAGMSSVKQAQAMWPNRVSVAREVLNEARRNGRADDFEPRIWETMLGLWLVKGQQFREASQVLQTSGDRWEKIWGPNDKFVRAIRAVQVASDYGALRTDPNADPTALARAKEQIRALQADRTLEDQVHDVLAEVEQIPGT